MYGIEKNRSREDMIKIMSMVNVPPFVPKSGNTKSTLTGPFWSTQH